MPNTSEIKQPAPAYRLAVGDGETLPLVDADGRDFLQPTMGQLPDAPEAARKSPDQINRIALTHMHTDHIGGVSDKQGAALFAIAALHAHRTDCECLFEPKMKDAVPPDLSIFFDCATECTATEADRTHLFAYADDLGKGRRVIDLAWHSPDQSGCRAVSNGEDMLTLGDVVPAAALAFVRPAWGVAVEADRVTAAASRDRALPEAAADKSLIAGMDLAFPGIGRASPAGDGDRFHPVPWSYPV